MASEPEEPRMDEDLVLRICQAQCDSPNRVATIDLSVEDVGVYDGLVQRGLVLSRSRGGQSSETPDMYQLDCELTLQGFQYHGQIVERRRSEGQ